MKKSTLNVLLLAAISMSLSGCLDKVKETFHKDRDDRSQNRTTTSAKEINFSEQATFTASNQPFVQGTNVYSVQSQTTGDNGNYQKVAPLSNAEKAKIEKAFANTNKLRAEKGLPPLKYDENLGAYATVRAKEISKVFKHHRPDGASLTSGLKTGLGVGENIAAGHSSADKTVLTQWRNSSGHYRNMVDERYVKIGIGHYHDKRSQYGDYWVQIFALDEQTDSIYQFDQSAAPAENPAMESFLAGKISAPNGKINLGNAPISDNQAARAYRSGELNHGIYKTARHYDQGGYQAIIQDPAGVFSYQTFGEVVNANGAPVQFVNIGQPTIPAENANFQATYQGASIGSINRENHVYADVSATVNFGDQKTMNVRFSNSQVAPLTSQQLQRAAHLDFSENLNWDSRQGKFNGSTTHANFYGPNGEEMGGNFSRQVQQGTYQGAFGLQKVN